MFIEIMMVIGKTIIAITLMFILTKISGKRQLSEMSLFGYISGISVGNIAAYIALEADKLWIFGIVSLIVWVLITLFLEKSTLKSKKLRKIIDSDRRVLVANGVVLRDELKKEELTVEELLEALREKDVYRIADLESASIEANGDISVFLKAEHMPLTPSMIGYPVEKEKEPITLIVDGSAELDTMKRNGLDMNWLEKQLAKANVTLDQVFVAQYIKDKSVSIHTMDSQTLEVKLEKENSETQLSQSELVIMKKSLLQALAIIEQQAKSSR